MRVSKRAPWLGLLLIGLAVAVWFAAPTSRSCVTDTGGAVCDTTGVVVLNLVGLLFFVLGAGILSVAGSAMRGGRRERGRLGGDDTR